MEYTYRWMSYVYGSMKRVQRVHLPLDESSESTPTAGWEFREYSYRWMRVQGVQLPLDESSESTPTAGCIDGVIAGVTVHIVDIHHGGLEITSNKELIC